MQITTNLTQINDQSNPINDNECDHNYFHDQVSAEVKCSRCGLVKTSKIIMSNKTPPIYGEVERKEKQQNGPPMGNLMPCIKMSTYIRKSEIDSPELRRAAKWDNRYPWKVRNLIQAMAEIRRVANILSIPKWVQDDASILYRKIHDKGFLVGRTIQGVLSGALYYALNSADIPITIDELGKEMGIDNHTVNKNYFLILKKLNLKSPIVKPKHYLNRFLNVLDIEYNIAGTCGKCLDLYIKVYPTSGKDPKGIVAGIIYYVVKKEKISINQTTIAKKCQITDVTLRKRYKEMEKLINYIQKKRKSKISNIKAR